ncbi:phosphate signaling complex protein PhoU [Marinicella rhabdoformis]|uniref:phosphate signaling complex protein PhoU n=1 Tax=Marinicella rhabdoformis TaxID=2580566 RepID=UPI0012AEB489|nr:phosphate signaling complex protein PhoU [Marinicella rhabdoformis]
MEHLEFDQHTSKEYNNELEDIRNHLLKMGGMVENQLRKAMLSLKEKSADLVQDVLEKGDAIDDLEIELDGECIRIIAKRQPAASDLRLIIAVMKSITDLERIGDQAEKVAYVAQDLISFDYSSPFFVEIDHLGQKVLSVLSASLNALARLDADQAIDLVQKDEMINAHFNELNDHIINQMVKSPHEIKALLRLSHCAKALERMGDHAKNICEYTIYLVKGKDIRHKDIQQVKNKLFD